tara:strand:+ start:106 stop:834 length:729 start_codon:yes stop_codon:yes gene_type:complete
MSVSQVISSGLQSMCNDYAVIIIRQLADKYHFDAEEAIRSCITNTPSLKVSVDSADVTTAVSTAVSAVDSAASSTAVSTPRVTPKKGGGPAFALPWSGTPHPDWCCALRSNYGIYSQCTNSKISGFDFCKTCQKHVDKNGVPNCGTVSDRANPDFKDPKGKKPNHYTTFMKKMKLSESDVRDEAARFHFTLLDSHFIPQKSGRGRPKKQVVVNDSDDHPSPSSPPPSNIPIFQHFPLSPNDN